MIRLNSDVKPHPTWAMPAALLAAEGVYADIAGVECVVTSGMEGPHVPGSAHARGAVDLRIRHVPEAKWDAVEAALKARLPQYIVRLERTPPTRLKDKSRWAPHIHLEPPADNA